MDKAYYFDYMATTPVDLRVEEAMQPYWGGVYGNPSSQHAAGIDAADAIEQARLTLLKALNADEKTSDLIWTSGATESNALAILGATSFYHRRGKHCITWASAHSSVLALMRQLQDHGYDITVLPIKADGLIDCDVLAGALRDDTVLVSCLWVNNETGVVQPIKQIGDCVKANGALLHVDGAQAMGRVPMCVDNIDLLSLCAHKMYGPKGIGALYRRSTVHLTPLWGHDRAKLRPGTLPTSLAVGMAAAAEWVTQTQGAEQKRLRVLRDGLWETLVLSIMPVQINGAEHARVADVLNITIAGVNGDALREAMQPYAVSNSSACQASAPSHVLTAMGLSQDRADASLRMSLGRYTTQAFVDALASHLINVVRRLRLG